VLIADLADHPHFIPLLADAFALEWPQWAATVSRHELEEIFRPDPTLLAVLVAFEGGEAIGTIALRRWFSETAIDETPWVRQLYVFARHRGRGIDRLLGAAIEQRARDLGFPCLYAATNRIEPLLLRRGWEAYRRVEHDGQPMAWLRKKLVSETIFRSAKNGL
jgi:GNAT superfamily N-acetyltransferase